MAGLAAAASPEQDGRIIPAKSKEKGLKHGTIEYKNDTGKDCNDFHIFFKPNIPTIESIKIKGGGNPFKSGYRAHSAVGGQNGYADFGRQEGDKKVEKDDTIVVEIAWKDDMPEVTACVWTLDGLPQSAPENAAAQELKILGKDADAERKAKAAAAAKVKAEQEKQAKEDAEKAKKEEEKAKKEEEKAKKEAERREKAEKGMQKSVVPDGLHSKTIQTPNGRLTVLLPGDMAAGDRITGTVVAEPTGKTEAERLKNSDELSGYVIEADGNIKGRLGDGRLSLLVPAAGAMSIALLTRGGKRVASADFPVQPQPGPTPPSIELPKAGQTGRPFAIRGALDPAKLTEVTIGGQPATVLASSPRQASVIMPRDMVGPKPIQVSEGGRVLADGQIAAIKISLSAPKTTLLKGESTAVRVKIEGLQALSYAGDRLEVYFDPAYAIIQNHTPGIIEFFGPGSQPFEPTLPLPLPPGALSIRVSKNEVSAIGVFERTLQVRSKAAGSFSISAHFLPGF